MEARIIVSRPAPKCRLEKKYIKDGSGRSEWKISALSTAPLFLIYIAWTTFYLLSRGGLLSLVTMQPHTLIFGQLGGFAFPGQYFFLVIFQLAALFPILRMVTPRSAPWVIGATVVVNSIIVYVFGGNEWVQKVGYRPFTYWLGYAVLGIYLARGWFSTSRTVALAVAVILIALAPLDLSSLPEVASYSAVSVSLSSIAILAAVFSPGRRHDLPLFVATSLSHIGKNSLAIFVSNPFFLALLREAPIGQPAKGVATIIGGLILADLFRRVGLGKLVGRSAGKTMQS